MNKFLCRKLLMAMSVLISATALVWFGHIDGGVYSAVVIAIVGGYMAANVTEKRIIQGQPA